MLRGVMWEVAAQHPDRAKRLEQRLKLEVGRRLDELGPVIRRKRYAGESCHEEESAYSRLHQDGIRDSIAFCKGHKPMEVTIGPGKKS